MDINLASIAGNLNGAKRRHSDEEAAAPRPSRNGRVRRLVAAMSALLAVVGL